MQLKFRKNTQRFGQGDLLKVGEQNGLFLFISGTLAVHSYGRFWKKGDATLEILYLPTETRKFTLDSLH